MHEFSRASHVYDSESHGYKPSSSLTFELSLVTIHVDDRHTVADQSERKETHSTRDLQIFA